MTMSPVTPLDPRGFIILSEREELPLAVDEVSAAAALTRKVTEFLRRLHPNAKHSVSLSAAERRFNRGGEAVTAYVHYASVSWWDNQAH